jgi:hypothetical protein
VITPDAATVAQWAKAVRDEVTNFCSHTGPPQPGEIGCLDCERIVAPVVGAALTLHAHVVAELERERDEARAVAVLLECMLEPEQKQDLIHRLGRRPQEGTA